MKNYTQKWKELNKNGIKLVEEMLLQKTVKVY